MNENMRINSSFAKSFLSFGAAIAVLTAGLFIFKFFTGYTDVDFTGDYKNCSVSVRKEIRYEHDGDGSRRKIYYYVTVACDEINYEQTFQCKQEYYSGFSEYNGRSDVRLKFFTSEDGVVFPVYHYSADAREAELEYREIYPPYGWYLLYGIGAGLAVIAIVIGLKAKHTAAVNAAYPAKTSEPTKEQNEMAAEIDRLLAQDKYGRYRNKKYK